MYQPLVFRGVLYIGCMYRRSVAFYIVEFVQPRQTAGQVTCKS